MWVKNLKLQNLRGFANPETIEFCKGINVLVGPNNAGKSTILKAIYYIQKKESLSGADIRKKEREFTLDISVEDRNENDWPGLAGNYLRNDGSFALNLKVGHDGNHIRAATFPGDAARYGFEPIHNREPRNFIYPFLSKRKVNSLSHEINQDKASVVNDDFTNLYAKVDRLSTSGHPKHSDYADMCNKIFGFVISSSPSSQGKHAGFMIDDFDHISVEEMGAGTINILGLIVNLCVAERKLFLIEELENDIHPRALKYLLELIIEKSRNNQFVISTHSNIVVRYLCSISEAKLFDVEMSREKLIPVSTVSEVKNDPENRLRVLEELGYELIDFELWPYYLILEESSAERIIEDFLIPEFVPGLKGKLRTIACQGNKDVEPRLTDFLRLFVFIHTTPIYKNRAWVLIDGDQEGKNIIDRLKVKFSSWNADNFNTFSQDNFEKYYPECFSEKVANIVTLGKAEKRIAKKELLDEVLRWIEANSELSKVEFKKSAADVIGILKVIEKAVKGI